MYFVFSYLVSFFLLLFVMLFDSIKLVTKGIQR